MDSFATRYGEWALIAGGASGIGAAFSELLARRGVHLALVDMNSESLATQAQKLQGLNKIRVRTLVVDLADHRAPELCMELISEIDCRLMIYVAAYSRVGSFLKISSTELNRYLSVNAGTPLQLVHRFAGRLSERHQSGGIILISSLAGFLGPPLVAPYAATKGFLIRLAESLSGEFKPLGMDISVCCAGLTHTPTYITNTPEETRKQTTAMDPMLVAEYALSKLGNRVVCIAGWKNRIVVWFLIRLLPGKTALRILKSEMMRMYRGETG